jgi:chemotaxis protein MotB
LVDCTRQGIAEAQGLLGNLADVRIDEFANALASERDGLKQVLKARSEDLDRANTEIAKLVGDRNTQSAELNKAKADYEQAKAEIAGLVAALEKANTRIASLKSERDQLAQDLKSANGEKVQLKDRISDLESQLAQATSQRDQARADLATATAKIAELNQTVAALQKKIDEYESELRRANEEIKALQQQRDQLAADLAAAKAQIAQLEKDVDQRSTELQVANATIAQLNLQITGLNQQIVGLNQKVADLTRERDQAVADLKVANSRIAELQDQIGRLNADLAAAAARIAELQATVDSLTAELAAARKEIADLRCKVDQLGAQRSEFFAGLLNILGGTKDVAIMGDRFVVPSSVFFKVGSDAVSKEGQETIKRVAALVEDLQAKIPTSIDWVLQVNGHADKQKIIRGGRFANNWQLSTARALAVVILLQDGGVVPQHLAAAGFGEYQPRADGSSQADYAMNRRIEFKLTDDGPFKGPTAPRSGPDGQCPSLVSQL